MTHQMLGMQPPMRVTADTRRDRAMPGAGPSIIRAGLEKLGQRQCVTRSCLYTGK